MAFYNSADIAGWTQYNTDPTSEAATAMEQATGHKSLEIFRLGYMLHIMKNHQRYSLDDLSHIMSPQWEIPISEPYLADSVRGVVFYPCNFTERISDILNGTLEYTSDNLAVIPAKMPAEVRKFIEYYGPDKNAQVLRRTTALPIETIGAVLCAEIWCTWDKSGRASLPSRKAFIRFFGPGMAEQVKRLVGQLKKACAKEQDYWNYLDKWYSDNVDILTEPDALRALVKAI